MEYSDDYLREQLPKEDPPTAYVPLEVTREIGTWIERGKFEDPQLLARSVRWTYAILSELSLGNYRTRGPLWIDYPWRFSTPLSPQTIVGLYDKNLEERGFGLSINLPDYDGPPFLVLTTIEFPRLGRSFPFALRKVRTELHSAPNPKNATTACWGRCNSTNRWGIVTAGHAVGTTQAGLAIPLDDGTAGISDRCFWQPIDAAFVLANAPATTPALLPIRHFPAAGLPVTVECKGGSQSRTISSACNSQGFYQTRSFPVLFFIDQPCAPGDSGALVRLTTGEAGGIYNGAQPSPDTGSTTGRALNFAQAMFSLGTTAYL